MNIKTKLKFSIINNSVKKKNKKYPFVESEAEMYEIPRDSKNPDLINSHYFTAHNESKSFYLRIAFRGNGDIETWFLYKDEKNIYILEQQLFKEKENMPFTIKCAEISKKWIVTFKGELTIAILSNDKIIKPTSNKVLADLEVSFDSKNKIFNFSTALDSRLISKALSKSKWDKDFRNNSNYHSQVHYEQLGNINVIGNIGKQKISLSSYGIRDHSYGIRVWNYMNKHIWLMMLNKDVSINYSFVDYPHMNSLQTAYLERNDEFVSLTHKMDVLTFSNNLNVPSIDSFSLTFNNEEVIKIQMEKEFEFRHFFSNDEYCICEGVGTFIVNGIKCKGIMEFGYNKKLGMKNENN